MSVFDRKAAPNYFRLRTEDRLWRAWNAVRASGLASSSPYTRADIKAFEEKARNSIKRLATELRQGKFDFGTARGTLIPRGPKTPRPIVMAAVPARIVQRALLDELQQIRELAPAFLNANSFGGVQRKSRADAVNEALKELKGGALYFLRSDINDFFTRIPRDQVLERIQPHIDQPTAALLRDAIFMELANASKLTEWQHLFPDEERGVAQGFCLSSLFGNIILEKFDAQMNGRGVRCLRYVDDFLLLGPSESKVMAAFESALRLLDDLGMKAYDPRERSTEKKKAERGEARQSFDFLGCTLQPGRVRPNSDARKRLLSKVDARLQEGASFFLECRGKPDPRACLARVLYDVQNIVQGWRKSFAFCKESRVFVDIESEIDARLDDFTARFWRAHVSADAATRRAMLGIPSLAA